MGRSVPIDVKHKIGGCWKSIDFKSKATPKGRKKSVTIFYQKCVNKCSLYNLRREKYMKKNKCLCLYTWHCSLVLHSGFPASYEIRIPRHCSKIPWLEVEAAQVHLGMHTSGARGGGGKLHWHQGGTWMSCGSNSLTSLIFASFFFVFNFPDWLAPSDLVDFIQNVKGRGWCYYPDPPPPRLPVGLLPVPML